MKDPHLTLVAVYARLAPARRAADGAVTAGAAPENVSVLSEPSFEAFRSASGGLIPDDEVRAYVETLRQAAHAVVVEAEAGLVQEIAGILARFDPLERGVRVFPAAQRAGLGQADTGEPWTRPSPGPGGYT